MAHPAVELIAEYLDRNLTSPREYAEWLRTPGVPIRRSISLAEKAWIDEAMRLSAICEICAVLGPTDTVEEYSLRKAEARRNLFLHLGGTP